MQKFTLSAAVFAVTLALGTTGCYNLNTDPYDPLENQTNWESFQVNCLGCHDCREYPDKCRPICEWSSSKIQKNTQQKWEQFKNYQPLVYSPVGDRFLDNTAILIAKVTTQMHNEVIIPYIEYDSNGDLALFQEFSDLVSNFQKQRKVSRAEAVQVVWSEWMKQDAAKCARVQNAFILLENQTMINQLSRMLQNTRPELQRLLKLDWNREIKRIRKECKNDPIIGYTKIGLISAQLLPVLNNSLSAGEFLLRHFQEQREMDEELINMVSNLNNVQ